MPKQSGLGQRCYVGGYNLSGDVGSIQNVNGGPQALDLTDITQSGYQRNGGLLGGAMAWTSYFNVATGRAHPVLSALPRTDTAVSLATPSTPGSALAVGDPCASLQAIQIGYDGNRDQPGNFTFNLSAQSDQYPLEWGQLLTAGERTDTTATASGTGLDGSASSTFGAQFYLHLTAFTGTSVTVRIQDSADNATFADLSGAAFAAATGVGWQRIAVTGTVRRYVRVATAGTFSSATFVVNAVRNAIAITY